MKTKKTLIALLTIVSFQMNLSAFTFNSNLKEPVIKKPLKFTSSDKANVYLFKQTFKVSCGYSNIINKTNHLLNNYQDTSSWTFSSQNYTPTLSLTHEIYLGNILSFSYSLGYASNRININSENIQNRQFSAFIKPKLSVFRRKNIEGYVQLNLGVVYNDMPHDRIPSEIVERQLPPPFKMYTGFTPLGLNVRLTDRIWLNFEGSFWSYETVSAGIKFKFKENLNHPRNWVGMN